MRIANVGADRTEATIDGGSPRPRVVIVGGGFGGLYAAKALKGAAVDVTLVDRQNYHLFQPLLYQVATGALSAADIATPIRAIVRRQANVTTILGEVTAVDLAARQVVLSDGRLPYDYLILATGASHTYFGHDEWAERAPGLKGLDDALEMRRRIFLAFEAAEREPDPVRRATLLSFVVVGGGPTGVELAGALAEIAHESLRREFRAIDPGSASIALIDAGPRLLRSFSPKQAEAAERQLGRRGVEVRTDAVVAGMEPGAVVLAGGERLPAGVVLWAAGVVASPLGRSLGVALDPAGRVRVNPDLSVPGHPEVFVVGDLAALEDGEGRPLPGVAQVAIQQGRSAARVVRGRLDGKTSAAAPFRFKDRGAMAAIGRNAAIAKLGPLELSGFPAWVVWIVIHIACLIGFGNRLVVLTEWVCSYLTRGRTACLISGPYRATDLAASRNAAERGRESLHIAAAD